MKKLLSLLSAAALSFALVPRLHASALSGGAFLPVEAAREYFGDEIQGSYYTSSGRQTVSFRYYGTDTFPLLFGYDDSLSYYDQDIYDYITSATFIIYSAELPGVINDPTQIILDIEPTYSIFDTTKIISCIGASGTYYSPDAYISASWDWYFHGESHHFESPENTFGYGMRCRSNFGEVEYNLVPAVLTSSSATSGYSVRGVFPVADSTCYVAIGCPFLSAGSTAGTGSLPAGSGTTTISGSSPSGSNVDMSETNGILDAIRSGISGLAQSILDGLVFLFVPREGFFDSLLDQMRARFSWYTSIENAFNAIRDSFSGSDFNSPPNVSVVGDNRTFFGAPIGSFSAPALVLDWFTAHRAAARTVQSAFMWLFFLLRIYKHLPAIIAGNEGALDESGGDE